MKECVECAVDFPSSACMKCINNPNFEDNFKQKINPLKNLFDGAPVLVKDNNRSNWNRRTWHKENFCHPDGNIEWTDTPKSYPHIYWNIVKLPAASESPRDVWLAAPIKFPKELIGKHVLVRYSDGNVNRMENLSLPIDWDEVVRYMLLSDIPT